MVRFDMGQGAHVHGAAPQSRRMVGKIGRKAVSWAMGEGEGAHLTVLLRAFVYKEQAYALAAALRRPEPPRVP